MTLLFIKLKKDCKVGNFGSLEKRKFSTGIRNSSSVDFYLGLNDWKKKIIIFLIIKQ